MLRPTMKTRAHAPTGRDRASVAGKQPAIEESTDLLIVGAGPAGLAAALAAAGGGVRVTLVDEHPVSLQTMGEDVPLHFGGRMAPAMANRNTVLESVLFDRPQLAEAIECGIDVRLGTTAWGLFPQRRTTGWIEGHVAGLADEDRAYLLRFRQAILATGCRDMGVAFDGWQLPGVMGASAAYRLATTYQALECTTAVLVGSGAAALKIGHALLEAGVRVAAVVEQAARIVGPAELLASLCARGARVFTRHVVQQAVGDRQGVVAVELAAVDEHGRRTGGCERIACDTVLLGVAMIPAIELFEATGCGVGFQAERGGHVPVVDAAQRTSLPFLYAAGDCAGVWPAKVLAEDAARREGRVAAAAALTTLGAASPVTEVAAAPERPARDISLEWLAWVRAMTLESPSNPFVCQCEQVTAADILELNPPRYLQWRPDGAHACRLESIDPEGAPHPDGVKRLTRAGMGPCQGRRCREQIATLMALGSGRSLADIPLATYRPPVRPLRLSQLASLPEAPAMTDNWTSWFGMPSQWVPFWQVPPSYSVVGGGMEETVAGE